MTQWRIASFRFKLKSDARTQKNFFQWFIALKTKMLKCAYYKIAHLRVLLTSKNIGEMWGGEGGGVWNPSWPPPWAIAVLLTFTMFFIFVIITAAAVVSVKSLQQLSLLLVLTLSFLSPLSYILSLDSTFIVKPCN